MDIAYPWPHLGALLRQSADSWYLGDVDVAGFTGGPLVGACRIDARRIWRERCYRSRHHLGAILGRGTEDAAVSDEVTARAENQRDQRLERLVRREHNIGSAISPGLLEAHGKPAVGQFLQPVVRNGWAGKIAAQMFDPQSIARYLRHLGPPTEEPSMAVPTGPRAYPPCPCPTRLRRAGRRPGAHRSGEAASCAAATASRATRAKRRRPRYRRGHAQRARRAFLTITALRSVSQTGTT